MPPPAPLGGSRVSPLPGIRGGGDGGLGVRAPSNSFFVHRFSVRSLFQMPAPPVRRLSKWVRQTVVKTDETDSESEVAGPGPSTFLRHRESIPEDAVVEDAATLGSEVEEQRDAPRSGQVGEDPGYKSNIREATGAIAKVVEAVSDFNKVKTAGYEALHEFVGSDLPKLRRLGRRAMDSGMNLEVLLRSATVDDPSGDGIDTSLCSTFLVPIGHLIYALSSNTRICELPCGLAQEVVLKRIKLGELNLEQKRQLTATDAAIKGHISRGLLRTACEKSEVLAEDYRQKENRLVHTVETFIETVQSVRTILEELQTLFSRIEAEHQRLAGLDGTRTRFPSVLVLGSQAVHRTSRLSKILVRSRTPAVPATGEATSKTGGSPLRRTSRLRLTFIKKGPRSLTNRGGSSIFENRTRPRSVNSKGKVTARVPGTGRSKQINRK